MRCCCRSPAISRSPTRWWRRGFASPPARRPTASSRRSKRSKARPAGWSGSATRHGAPIFVDYAHKPDALEKVLGGAAPLRRRPADRRVRLRRRPRPRQAADDGRDRRARAPTSSSSPTTIRARRTPPRSAPRSSPPRPARARSATAREAIRAGVALLEPGDALVVAGKGHETGQIVGERRAAVLRRRGGARGAGDLPHEPPALDPEANLPSALGAPAAPLGGARDRRLHRHAHASARRPVRRLKGDAQRRPRPCRARLRGAARPRRSSQRAPRIAARGPLLRRRRHACAAWSGWAQRPGARSRARLVAVTGSVGKTSAKEMLRARPCRRSGRRTPRPPPTTIIGACR